MKLFVYGGPRLPLGFRLGFAVDLNLRKLFAPAQEGQEGAFLYVIREHGEWSRSKVGVSQDPRRRLRELQTGNPTRLELHWCAVTPGTGYTIENEVKRIGEPLRASGEWFQISPSQMANLVQRASSQVGELLQQVPVDRIGDILDVVEELRTSKGGMDPLPLRSPWLFTAAVSAVAALVASVLLVLR